MKFESLPLANEVWDKVMFLHLCVILFTGEGLSLIETPFRQRPPPDTDHPRTQTLLRLRADGTHPTRIHSCFCH